VNIGEYSYDEYVHLVKSFHGSVAPGMVIGGFMVDLALRHRPEGDFFDAICETSACLPDAIQLLTPCTVGNGWLKILSLGRYALTLYEKYQGAGIRVFLDASKVDGWPEIKGWYFRLKSKKEQNSERLLEEIREAGEGICTLQKVVVKPQFMGRIHGSRIVRCPLCQEAYPEADGGICRGCSGYAPYETPRLVNGQERKGNPRLNSVPVEQAVGKRALHDMTLIVPGEEKGPAFKRGQILEVGDVCRLQKMGRQSVYVEEENELSTDWIHEDEAALSFARGMAGEGVSFTDAPKEGKVNFFADRDGLFMVDRDGLEMFNLVPGVVCASRQGYSVVSRKENLAGVRAVPLYLPRADFKKAMAVLKEGPIFRVVSMRKAKAGILVTGTEVFQGLVKDQFIPVIGGKLEDYGCEVVQTSIVPDDRNMISRAIGEFVAGGIDLLVTTAGLSVDPDDVTRQGLLDAGATDMLYGMPVIPGAMTLLARIGHVQVIGVPACALYFKTTSFDLLLPRLLADQFPTREDLACLGHGALCLECDSCRYPRCSFGR
jgi:formylmethanofuran dehydrogenase subunit E